MLLPSPTAKKFYTDNSLAKCTGISLVAQNTPTPKEPCSIYQYSNMAPRIPGQTSIFGVVFFVSKSPLGTERQKKL